MWYCWSRPLCQCYRSITHSLLHTQVQMDQWKFTTARKSQTMTENSVIFIPTPSLRTGAFECARGVVWVSPGNEGSQRKMGMQQFLLRCVTTFPLASFFFLMYMGRVLPDYPEIFIQDFQVQLSCNAVEYPVECISYKITMVKLKNSASKTWSTQL